MELKKLCFNKVFWSAITASFALSVLLFNIAVGFIDANADYTMDAIKANTDAIQITNEDVKKILSDTNYIRGLLENNGKN